MQNATRPGVAAPMPAPPQVPMMPTGYSAPQYPQYQPQPQVLYVSAPAKNTAVKSVNSIASSISMAILKIGLPLLFVLWGVYYFFQTDVGKGILEAAKWLVPIIGVIGAITGGAYLYKAASKAGFLGKAKKAEALAEDAKAAREAGELEKAEKLEKEAADTKAEAEAAGEEVKGVTESGKLAKEGEEAAKLAKEAREAEAAAQEAKELREAASFFRI